MKELIDIFLNLVGIIAMFCVWVLCIALFAGVLALPFIWLFS